MAALMLTLLMRRKIKYYMSIEFKLLDWEIDFLS